MITRRYTKSDACHLICHDCNKVYIGQTACLFTNRYKERIRYVRTAQTTCAYCVTNSLQFTRLQTHRGPGQLSRYSDSLRAGRSGDRIPVGAKFFAYVQTGPGAYPASYTMGTGSFPGVKRPGSGADHPPPTSAGVKNE
jgi:hypothetical protein